MWEEILFPVCVDMQRELLSGETVQKSDCEPDLVSD